MKLGNRQGPAGDFCRLPASTDSARDSTDVPAGGIADSAPVAREDKKNL